MERDNILKSIIWVVDKSVHRKYFPYLIKFFQALSKSDIHVSLICEEENDLYHSARHLPISVYSSPQVASRSRASIRNSLVTLRKFIAHREPSIVHFFSQERNFISPFTLKNLPKTHVIHYFLPNPTYCSFTMNDRITKSFISKFLYRFMNFNRVTSEYQTYIHAKEQLAASIDYLPAHLYLRSSHTNVSTSDSSDYIPLLAVISPLEKENRVDYLLQVMKEIASRRQKIRFLISGDGSERISLMLKADSLGLRERLVWSNGRPDIPQLLSQCDAVMFAPTGFLPVEAEFALTVGTPIFIPQCKGAENLLFDPCLGTIYKEATEVELAILINQELDTLMQADLRSFRKQLVLAKYDVKSFTDYWTSYYYHVTEGAQS